MCVHYGVAARPRFFGASFAPSVDPSERCRLRASSPALDVRVLVSAASVRHFRCVLLRASLDHLQDVLCAETAQTACV